MAPKTQHENPNETVDGRIAQVISLIREARAAFSELAQQVAAEDPARADAAERMASSHFAGMIDEVALLGEGGGLLAEVDGTLDNLGFIAETAKENIAAAQTAAESLEAEDVLHMALGSVEAAHMAATEALAHNSREEDPQEAALYDTPLEEVGLGEAQPAADPIYRQLDDGTLCLAAEEEKQVVVDVEGVRFTLPMTQENLANAVRRVFDVDDASILGIGEIEREGLGRLSLIRNSQIDDLEQLNALSAIAADADSRTLDAAETWWRSVPEEDEKTPELAMALMLNAEEIAYEPYSVSMEELANPSDEARFGASVFSHIYGAPVLAEFGWDIGRWGAYHANGTATLYENRAIYDDDVPNADLDQTGREEIAAAAVRIWPSVSPAANPDAPKFRVTFANAEGEEFGVTFPMDPADVPELSDAITMGGERDYFLADIDADDEYIFRSPDCNLADFFRGGGTLEQLNHAAILLASLDGTDREIAAILLSRIPGQATALNAANAALWAVDAPALAYENAREGMSPEEKFGRTLYEVKYPDELGVDELRDADWNIARYGRDLEGYIMGREGFSWTEGAYNPEPSEDDPERFEELAQGAIAHLREKAEFMGRSAAAENPHAITYQMLSRLKSDCDYFLGAGEGNEKHLWAKSADGQIAEMRRLLGTLPKGAEPEWLTPEDIDSYEQKMKGHGGEEATGSPEGPLDNYPQHRFGRTKVIDGEVWISPEATDNGMCWKDPEVALDAGDEICYVAEDGFDTATVPHMTDDEGEWWQLSAIELEHAYTMESILKIAAGSDSMALAIFEIVDWQHPETAFDEEMVLWGEEWGELNERLAVSDLERDFGPWAKLYAEVRLCQAGLSGQELENAMSNYFVSDVDNYWSKHAPDGPRNPAYTAAVLPERYMALPRDYEASRLPSGLKEYVRLNLEEAGYHGGDAESMIENATLADLDGTLDLEHSGIRPGTAGPAGESFVIQAASAMASAGVPLYTAIIEREGDGWQVSVDYGQGALPSPLGIHDMFPGAREAALRAFRAGGLFDRAAVAEFAKFKEYPAAARKADDAREAATYMERTARGWAIIDRKGDDVLAFRPNAGDRYAVGHGYNPKNGTWGQGYYTNDLGDALKRLNGEEEAEPARVSEGLEGIRQELAAEMELTGTAPEKGRVQQRVEEFFDGIAKGAGEGLGKEVAELIAGGMIAALGITGATGAAPVDAQNPAFMQTAETPDDQAVGAEQQPQVSDFHVEPAILLGAGEDDEWAWTVNPKGGGTLTDGEGNVHIEIYPERKAIYHNGTLLHGATDWTADKDDARIALEAYVAREERLPYVPPEGTNWDNLIHEAAKDLLRFYDARGPQLVRPIWPAGSFRRFEQELDEAIERPGAFNSRETIYVSDTPAIYLAMGMAQRPILLNKNKVAKLIQPKGTDGYENWHGLNREELIRIPELLASPAMVLDTLSPHRSDAIVVVFNATDRDSLPLVAAIKPAAGRAYDFEPLASNALLSIYGKDDFEGFLERAVEANKILFVDKEKTEELETQSQLQLLRGVTGLPLNQIIHRSQVIDKAEGRPEDAPPRPGYLTSKLMLAPGIASWAVPVLTQAALRDLGLYNIFTEQAVWPTVDLEGQLIGWQSAPLPLKDYFAAALGYLDEDERALPSAIAGEIAYSGEGTDRLSPQDMEQTFEKRDGWVAEARLEGLTLASALAPHVDEGQFCSDMAALLSGEYLFDPDTGTVLAIGSSDGDAFGRYAFVNVAAFIESAKASGDVASFGLRDYMDRSFDEWVPCDTFAEVVTQYQACEKWAPEDRALADAVRGPMGKTRVPSTPSITEPGMRPSLAADAEEQLMWASQGLAPEVFFASENPKVRAAVARAGYALHLLALDPDPAVRLEVARQGFGLDALTEDVDEEVRAAADKELAALGLAAQEFATAMPERTNAALFGQLQPAWLKNWIEAQLPQGAEVMDMPVMMIAEEAAAAGFDPWTLARTGSDEMKVALAEGGFELDLLYDDESEDVRAAVAARGFRPDIMAGDPSFAVRAAVAEAGHNHEQLAYDPSPYVRAAVAQAHGMLDILVADEHPAVELAVARAGYGLDLIMRGDNVEAVAEAARQLKQAGFETVEQWAEANPGLCAVPNQHEIMERAREQITLEGKQRARADEMFAALWDQERGSRGFAHVGGEAAMVAVFGARGELDHIATFALRPQDLALDPQAEEQAAAPDFLQRAAAGLPKDDPASAYTAFAPEDTAALAAMMALDGWEPAEAALPKAIEAGRAANEAVREALLSGEGEPEAALPVAPSKITALAAEEGPKKVYIPLSGAFGAAECHCTCDRDQLTVGPSSCTVKGPVSVNFNGQIYDNVAPGLIATAWAQRGVIADTAPAEDTAALAQSPVEAARQAKARIGQAASPEQKREKEGLSV